MVEYSTQDWLAECARRISISEGVSLTRYLDSLGVPTIGIGFNLQRGPAPLTAVGIADPDAVIAGTGSITEGQARSLLQNDLSAAVSNARTSLSTGTFDALTQARQFVIVDLVYNLGLGGWLGFVGTRDLINQAQKAKDLGNPNAHSWFVGAGDHLEASGYYSQVGNRAKRNVAMLVQGIWCDANGDGSDIYTP